MPYAQACFWKPNAQTLDVTWSSLGILNAPWQIASAPEWCRSLDVFREASGGLLITDIWRNIYWNMSLEWWVHWIIKWSFNLPTEIAKCTVRHFYLKKKKKKRDICHSRFTGYTRKHNCSCVFSVLFICFLISYLDFWFVNLFSELLFCLHFTATVELGAIRLCTDKTKTQMKNRHCITDNINSLIWVAPHNF